MREISFYGRIGLLAALAACGGGGGNAPAPTILAGGGIGGGAIDGHVNVYIIDDGTRLPVAGAAVTVGTVAGTTDATGLFVADEAALDGAQTISVAAPSYESQLWVGANGANITIDLKPAVIAVPTSAQLSGSIAGFSAISAPSGHELLASVGYSHDDTYADAANNLQSTSNLCDGDSCDFTITVRTGHVALFAAIFDHAGGATSLIGFAELGGLVVENGVDQTGLVLAQVEAGNLVTLTADLGTPPAGLPNALAIAGLDLPTDGTLEIPVQLSAGSATTLAPKLAAFAGAAYRLSAVANNGSGDTAAQSAVLRHPLTDTTLAAGTWLDPPAGITATTTAASWQPVTGALLYSVAYKTATSQLLDVTVLDGSTSVAIPAALAAPVSGDLLATVGAVAATLDVTDFTLDADREALTAESAQPVAVAQ